MCRFGCKYRALAPFTEFYADKRPFLWFFVLIIYKSFYEYTEIYSSSLLQLNDEMIRSKYCSEFVKIRWSLEDLRVQFSTHWVEFELKIHITPQYDLVRYLLPSYTISYNNVFGYYWRSHCLSWSILKCHDTQGNIASEGHYSTLFFDDFKFLCMHYPYIQEHTELTPSMTSFWNWTWCS